MKRITTTELAHSLAATLREVSAGEHVEVVKRGTVIARITPPDVTSPGPWDAIIEASRELGDEREELSATVAEVREFLGEDRRAWT